jgi:histone-lysine N-methyltransferase SETDB1
MVYESSKEVWADVHADSADFIRNYVNKYPERPMVRLSIGQVVTTEWNGQWWVARVVELDASLVKMKFENDGRLEWMYRGSTRLSPLYEKQNRQQTRQTARRHVSTVARVRLIERRNLNIGFISIIFKLLTFKLQAKNQPLIEYNYGDEEGKLKGRTV